MQKNDNVVRMLSKVPGEINLFTGWCIVWLNQQGKAATLPPLGRAEGLLSGVTRQAVFAGPPQTPQGLCFQLPHPDK